MAEDEVALRDGPTTAPVKVVLIFIQNWMDCCGDRGCCGEPEDGRGAIVTIDGVQWQGYGETPGLAVLNAMEYRAYSLTGEWPDGGGQHHEP